MSRTESAHTHPQRNVTVASDPQRGRRPGGDPLDAAHNVRPGTCVRDHGTPYGGAVTQGGAVEDSTVDAAVAHRR